MKKVRKAVRTYLMILQNLIFTKALLCWKMFRKDFLRIIAG